MVSDHTSHETSPLRAVRRLNPAQRMARDYEPIATWLGLIGNACFFVGSVLFLWERPAQLVGVWLFILGSFGMLVESVAGALRRSIGTPSSGGDE